MVSFCLSEREKEVREKCLFLMGSVRLREPKGDSSIKWPAFPDSINHSGETSHLEEKNYFEKQKKSYQKKENKTYDKVAQQES